MANANEPESDEPEGGGQQFAPGAIPGGVPGGGGFVQNAFGVPVQPSQTVGGSREQLVESPAMQADKAQMTEAGNVRGAAAIAEAEAQAQALEQTQGLAEQDIDAARAHAIDRQAAAYELNQRIELARQERDERVARASEDPTTFWDDRTAGERTMARIGVWLSAFGQGIAGGDNQAIRNINQQIEQDLKIKQQRAERLMKLAEMSSGSLADAYRQRAEELGDMDAQRLAAHNVVAQQIDQVIRSAVPTQLRQQALQKAAQWQGEIAQAMHAANQAVAMRVRSNSSTTTPLAPKSAPAPVYDPNSGQLKGAAAGPAAAKLNAIQNAAANYDAALAAAQQLEESSVADRFLPGEAAHKRQQAAAAVAVAQKALYPLLGTALGRGINQQLASDVSGATGSAHIIGHGQQIAAERANIKDLTQRAFNATGAGAIGPRPPAGPPAPVAPKTPREALGMIKARLKANPKDPVALRAWQQFRARYGGDNGQ